MCMSLTDTDYTSNAHWEVAYEEGQEYALTGATRKDAQKDCAKSLNPAAFMEGFTDRKEDLDNEAAELAAGDRCDD